MRRRRSPRRHEVHPKDQRYRISIFERGKGAYARITGDTGKVELPLDDPRNATEQVEKIKAGFGDKSPDEQVRILKALAYGAKQAELMAESGSMRADKVDDALRVRRTYNIAYHELEARYHQQRNADELGLSRGESGKVVRY